jgi:hypothetical protein
MARRELLTLAAELRQELEAARRLADEAIETWRRRVEAAEDERRTYVESVALKLHNFYTACERIFERVAGELNGALPQTPDWHLRLLRSMSLDVPEVRPPVISAELGERLGDYLRFRHLVRNVYGFELDESKMELLVARLGETAGDLAAQVSVFLDDLERLGREIGG